MSRNTAPAAPFAGFVQNPKDGESRRKTPKQRKRCNFEKFKQFEKKPKRQLFSVRVTLNSDEDLYVACVTSRALRWLKTRL